MSKIIHLTLLCVVFLANYAFAEPGLQLGATRLIYNGTATQATVDVKNSDSHAYLIQSWVSDLNGKKDKDTFITTPPLFKLEDNSSNTVRVVYTGKALPQDSESVFWLNIKAIPSREKTDKNTLTIAIKSQIKLFYRPEALKDKVNDAYNHVRFTEKNGQLVIVNPTPFNVSFNDIKINNTPIKDAVMVSPFSSMNVNMKVSPGQKVYWNAINDYGGITADKTETISKFDK